MADRHSSGEWLGAVRRLDVAYAHAEDSLQYSRQWPSMSLEYDSTIVYIGILCILVYPHISVSTYVCK